MIIYYYIFACSIMGFVWSEILTQPGHIFNWLFNYIDKTYETWISKPLGGCALCVTGQLALWTYILFFHNNYSVFTHIYFISQSIFITWLLLKLQEKLS